MNIFQLTDSKQYYLSSTSKIGTKMNTTYNSKINFQIPRFIIKRPNILYNTLKVIHAEIPYSFYIINSTNNILILKNNTTSVFSYFTVPEGNYNAFTLLTVLNSFHPDFIFSLNSSTGKYSIESVINFNIPVGSTIIKLISGILNTVYISTLLNSKYYINLPYPVNLMGTKNIFIKCNLILENLQSKTSDNQTLKSIPVNVPPFGLVLYNNNENIESLIKNSQIDNLNIEIVDDDNNLINFNNQDWTITLELKTVLQVSQNSQSIEEYLNQN